MELFQDVSLCCGADSDAILSQTLVFYEHLKAEAEQLSNERKVVESLISFLDLTALAGDDSKTRIQKLIRTAVKPIEKDPELKCAAVCVYPARIVDAIEAMQDFKAPLPIASVAGGFPSGQFHLQSRLLEIELAIADGAVEIDAVINRAAVLESNWQLLFDEITKMEEICREKAKLKIILSTGELGTKENIYNAAMAAMCAGADFVKTSTGKEAVNATLESAYVMCLAIRRYHSVTGRKVGFKPAGGIKTVEQALQYQLVVKKLLGEEWMTPGLFRIGASTLLDDIRLKLDKLP